MNEGDWLDDGFVRGFVHADGQSLDFADGHSAVRDEALEEDDQVRT